MPNDTTPYLGRCGYKDCDYALFATSDDIKVADDFRGVKAGMAPVRVGNGHVFGRCTNGHKFFRLNPIKGTYSPDHKCDARCLNAKGHNCTCSCGGANHGAGHAVTVVTAAQAPTEEMATEKQSAFIGKLLNEREIPANGEQSGAERESVARTKLDQAVFTKKQASATITWLLTLPTKENN